jgi:hypothetical protein
MADYDLTQVSACSGICVDSSVEVGFDEADIRTSSSSITPELHYPLYGHLNHPSCEQPRTTPILVNGNHPAQQTLIPYLDRHLALPLLAHLVDLEPVVFDVEQVQKAQ